MDYGIVSRYCILWNIWNIRINNMDSNVFLNLDTGKFG
jgi:hypothetical protein